jgi:hypothetical protein
MIVPEGDTRQVEFMTNASLGLGVSLSRSYRRQSVIKRRLKCKETLE